MKSLFKEKKKKRLGKETIKWYDPHKPSEFRTAGSATSPGTRSPNKSNIAVSAQGV